MISIAEIGINHNGSYTEARYLIKESLKHCDYAKIQIKNPEVCVPKEQQGKVKVWNNEIMSYLEYKKIMELSDNALDRLFKEFGNRLIASVWDVSSLYRYLYHASLYSLSKVPRFIKIPSSQLTNKALFDAAYKTGVPIIFSTGMSTEHELDEVFREYSRQSIIPLVCNSQYPHDLAGCDLSKIQVLKNDYMFPEVGFSNHCVEPAALAFAVAAGADYIEFHVTRSKHQEGTDHASSIEVSELEAVIGLCNLRIVTGKHIIIF